MLCIEQIMLHDSNSTILIDKFDLDLKLLSEGGLYSKLIDYFNGPLILSIIYLLNIFLLLQINGFDRYLILLTILSIVSFILYVKIDSVDSKSNTFDNGSKVMYYLN